MFCWCAYCQRLTGEKDPLTDYRFTHGICPACADRAEVDPSSEVIHAAQVFSRLVQAGSRGDLRGCETFIAHATDAGLRSSDILIGVLHPALVEIGRRWERGEVSVADEHHFTAFCQRVIALLPRPVAPPADAPIVLLVPFRDNAHDLGVRMLELVTEDHGRRCTAVYPGLPDAEVIALARRLRPALAGISVALPATIPAAIALAGQLAALTPAPRVVVGGFAFRTGEPVEVPPGIAVARTIDDYLGLLRDLGG